MADLPEHVARNRAYWDDRARDYVAEGRRNWESAEPQLGAAPAGRNRHPYRWIPEAARLLRRGGELAFLVNSVRSVLCGPDPPARRRDDPLPPHRARVGAPLPVRGSLAGAEAGPGAAG
jgi:hypothetical protein